MNSEVVIEVVNKLTGRCFPLGDTSIDESRYENLNLKIDLVDELISDIVTAGKLYNRSEYSILKISNKANEFLTELRDWLNEIEYLPQPLPEEE